MKEKINKIIDKLTRNTDILKKKSVTVGFDGFIDSIVKVIKDNGNEKNYNHFLNMRDFGTYITQKSGKSCSMELDEQEIKIGGNMPIIANALGKLGVQANCIGAMGYPEINEVFKKMSDNCKLYTVAKPGYCNALEFSDGKVMLAKNIGNNYMNWELIKKILSQETLIDLFTKSDMMGVFNWSEVLCSSDIWNGILSDILKGRIIDKSKYIFFDLSDCSRRNNSEVLEALKLIEKFNQYFSVILSLNENEANCIYKAMEQKNIDEECHEMGNYIYHNMKIDCLIIHTIKYSLAWEKDKKYKINNLHIKEPILSTGGGDNFNAGIFISKLINVDITSSLILASAMSSFYVSQGYSAGRKELVNYLEMWKSEL